MKTYLAIDIGASSGRHILGWLEEGKLKLSEIYRFKNGAVPRGGHRCWDADGLCASVIKGIAKCAENEEIENPVSAAIDTWGVDFVLLDENMKRIGEAVAYRDSRTEGIPEELDAVIRFEELYARTGIQKQTFNTVYQLAALKKEAPEQLDKAEHFLMIRTYPMEEIFDSDAIVLMKHIIDVDLSFVLMAAAFFLLSYIFSYGQALQRESDETL